MTRISRRGVLAGTMGAGAVTATGLASATTAPTTAPTTTTPAAAPDSVRGPVTVTPDDPRYPDLLLRRMNARFDRAKPGSVQLVRTTRDVVRAVQDAVRTDKRITVRSGGHCFEDFVDSPDTETIIDLGEMSEVGFDARRRAFVVEPGATLGDVYKTLYYTWGVTIPAGGCLGVGAGGHFSGGGYGPMSRMFGSVVDFLYAVEVVVVDADKRVRAIVATREPDDPHRDLWWAHTGGGGGNFGIVTRYWLRSKGARGADPSKLLPKPPPTLLTSAVVWKWKDLKRDAFVRLMRNHGRFFEENSGPDSPYAGLYCPLLIPHSSTQEGFLLSIQMDATVPNAERLVNEFVEGLSYGVGVEPDVYPTGPIPWLTATLQRSVPETAETTRHKLKAGYLRRSYTEKQFGVIYDHLNDGGTRSATVLLVPYGGQVNTVAPGATATPQRDSILKMVYQVDWQSPEQDDEQLAWSRKLYSALYADTGGVPVPNDINDGSYINYPDADLADPEWNRSGVPWHTLYYKDNYPRLQRIKAAYDPGNVFRHSLSIRS